MEHVEEEAYTESGDAMPCLLNPRQDVSWSVDLTAKTVHGAGKGRIREGKWDKSLLPLRNARDFGE